MLCYRVCYCVVMHTDTDADRRQCTPDTPGICHQHATCNRITSNVCACNPASSYRCECDQGYHGDGLTCIGNYQR